MYGSLYRVRAKTHLSEKTGTIDRVEWSAQERPFKIVSVLTFTDGEEISTIAVDDSMLSWVQQDRAGTFTFCDAGGFGALIGLVNSKASVAADGQAWARAAQRKFLQSAALVVPAVALLGLAAVLSNLLLAATSLPLIALTIWFAYVGSGLQRVSAAIHKFPPNQRAKSEKRGVVGSPASARHHIRSSMAAPSGRA